MHTGRFRGFEVDIHAPGIAVITMNEPDRMNGQTHGFKRDMTETFYQAQMDDHVRVVVVTGSGGVFSAGDDITGRPRAYDESQKLTPGFPRPRTGSAGGAARTYASLRTVSQQLNLSIRHLDKVTIAAIDGAAIQTGLSLALACDFRIASTHARLGSGTLRWAMQPDEGGHFLVVQLIGLARALEFFLDNKVLSAQEAHDIGLVHEVVPQDKLFDRAMEKATRLANGPQVAIRLLKRSLYNAAEMSMLNSFDDIAVRTAVSDHHPDVREGLRAFREKREPKYNAWLDEERP